jgi:hypothetical protein
MNEQQRAVVQQALEALEDAVLDYSMGKGAVARHVEAITALRQLLEQPEPVQEPQAFLHWYDNAHWGNEDFKEGCHRSWNAAIKYTTPPAQPAAWVGLTEEDLYAVRVPMSPEEIARAIEAKLKEKNT